MKKTSAFQFFNKDYSVKAYSDMYKKLRLDIRYPANVKREQIFVELLQDSQGPQDFAQPLPQEHAGNVPHRAPSEPEWIHQIFDQAPGSSFLPLPFDNSLNRKPELSTRREEFRFPG